MQRIINDPMLVVEDMLKGFEKVHSDLVYIDPKAPRAVVSKHAKDKKKVGIVTGGGSGHEPGFLGYCGRNMADAVAVGEIFSSPTAKAFYDCFKAVDQGMGVACLYGNFAGDNMNVKMAIEMAEDDDITVKKVVAIDDVASAKKDEANKRRGGTAEIFMWKCAGAVADKGGNLDEVIAVAEKVIANSRSTGVGLSPCVIPANGKANFEIKDGTCEFGIGHHGEPGIKVEKLGTAKEIAEQMVEIVVNDVPFVKGDEVAILISGLGATPVMEQYIYFDEVSKILANKGINVYKSYVGNYFTSLEMNGITITIMKLDDQLKECLDYECETVALKQF